MKNPPEIPEEPLLEGFDAAFSKGKPLRQLVFSGPPTG
jgi:hypothetical protein